MTPKIKIGDTVAVAHCGRKYQGTKEFQNNWVHPMDKAIGKLGLVKGIDPDSGVKVKVTEIGAWNYPPQCLLLMKKGD